MMRRGGWLFALLLIALGALLAVAVQTSALESSPRLVHVHQSEPGRYVVIGVVLYDKQTGQEVIVYNGSGFATVPPSDTPSPAPPIATDTPVAASPTPTLTPSATNTPIAPTTTPGVPTPTPESGIPPVTPDGSAKVCELKVNVNTRIRSTPSATGTLLGTWPVGEPRDVYEFAVADGYLWARHGVARWSAVKVHPSDDNGWWADGHEGSRELCPDVPGWPAGLAPPPAIAHQGVGWTMVLGIPLATVLQAGEDITAAGYTPAATLAGNVAYGETLVERGWMVNARPWYNLGLRDDPDLTLTPEASARARVQALEHFVGTLHFTAVQLTNETTWPSADYLNRWILEAVRQCDARGWECMPVVFSTGTPELDWWSALRPALRAMRASGHWLGYNAYPYQRDLMLCDQTQLYTTWRIRLVRQAVGEDLPRVWVTEAARGAGDVPPILSDSLCFVERAFEGGDYDVITLWFAGQADAWQAAVYAADQIKAFGAAFLARMA